MAIKFDDKPYPLKLLFDRAFAALKKSDRPGEVIYLDHPRFQRYLALIRSQVRLSEKLTAMEVVAVLERSLLALCRRSEGSLTAFLEEVAKEQTKTLSSATRSFKLATTVTARRPLSTRRNRPVISADVGIAIVQFLHRFPSKADVEPWFFNGLGDVDITAAGEEMPVVVNVEARNEEHAYERASAGLQIALGCLNFLLNSRTRILHSNPAEPINGVRPGRYQVLHDEKWERHEDTIWIEEYYRPTTFPKNLAEEVKKRELGTNLQRLTRRLRHPVFGPLLTEAVQDYQEALSYSDPHLTHFRLWALLERLTDTHRDDSKATIRRAAFLSTQREDRMAFLADTAARRHEFVHRRYRDPLIKDAVEDLRLWIEALMFFMFFTKAKLNSAKEFFALLDMPPDAAGINSRGRLARLAKKFRK